ncbi:MAG: hypothetical protein QOK37_2594 [Thermoanaerobaculia bacterium]|jgi:hypothetical protein|nr:hypothetical protein [Thermoanaerobaculia bacterium]
MKRRLILIAALPLLLAQNCPKPATSAGPKQTVTSGYEVELASAASPDSTQCPGGRLTIASWGSVFNGPLDGSAPFTDVTQQIYDAFPSKPEQPIAWGGDPLMARLPNGDILYSRQGNIGQNPDVLVQLPDGKVSVIAQLLLPPEQIMHGLQGFWISHDCGQHWQAHSTIDAQKEFNGVCAVSRKNADGTFLQAGWDRGEMTVDPWSGKVYFNTDCDSDAPDGQGYTTRLFALEPNSQTWTPSPVILPRAAPAVMTVTQSGALWLFHCVEDQPLLYRSQDGGMSFPPPTVVNAKLPASNRPACGSVVNATPEREKIAGHGSEELAGHQEVLVYDYGLARSGVESVRVTYPTLDGGRAHLVSVAATHKSNDDELFILNLVNRFTQEAADGSEIHETFIERDDVGAEKSPNLTALLYWLESSPGQNQLRVRYSVVRAGINYEGAKTLGAAWTPAFDSSFPMTNWAGDYQNGAYVCKDHKMNFVLVWPESDPAITAPNVGIHFATVAVDEGC